MIDYILKNNKDNLNQKGNGGYTLLFAVLVSSLVLAIGISILNISKKEFLLTTSSRDSASALYAADGGIECAVYGEMNGAFTTDVDNTSKLGCAEPNVKTNFQSISLNDPEGSFVFYIKLGLDCNSCAVVTVTKAIVDGALTETIDSKGYNIGWTDNNGGSCTVGSPKRVERALRLTY